MLSRSCSLRYIIESLVIKLCQVNFNVLKLKLKEVSNLRLNILRATIFLVFAFIYLYHFRSNPNSTYILSIVHCPFDLKSFILKTKEYHHTSSIHPNISFPIAPSIPCTFYGKVATKVYVVEVLKDGIMRLERAREQSTFLFEQMFRKHCRNHRTFHVG